MSAPVAVSVPFTVITPGCQADTGPSVMGVERVVGSGAPQPAWLAAAASIALSFRYGLAMTTSWNGSLQGLQAEL